VSAYVWSLPDEKPGTLKEIFDAEDSRRANLALVEISKLDGFRACSEIAGAPVDPDDLLLAVMGCINIHLHPLGRLADYRRELRKIARCAEDAAKALERLATAIEESGRENWVRRFSLTGAPDPTDRPLISELHDIASVLPPGAFKDKGGRRKMRAFEYLIRRLARAFEAATGRRATLTRHHYRSSRYSGRFWNFVEIIRPVAASIIETSGAGSLAQPGTEVARGKFIEDVLKKARTEKTRVASQ
jgi:hypothetical protein